MSGYTTRNVTLSIGVNCVVPQSETSVDMLIAGADEALYGAKGAGRDCVAIRRAGEPPIMELDRVE